MKDVNQKNITPPLAIDSEFLHGAFANPCTSKPLTRWGMAWGAIKIG
jgi:hypothetical protein